MKNKKIFLKAAWQLIYPFWLSSEWKIAWLLLTAIVSLNLGLVYVSVQINSWYASFYNSLQQKEYATFTSLIWYFCMLAGFYIVGAVYQQYLQQMLTIKWRHWLTDNLIATWLNKNRFYAIELFKFGTDNPDQRIAEDLRDLSDRTLDLALGLLSSVTTLVSFFLILWTLSGPISFSVFNQEITIPGYMVWAAFLYACTGSLLTHFIGRPLIALNFQQQKNEANFRYSLVRTREYADAIALAGGAPSEERALQLTFTDIISNYRAIMKRQKKLTWFTAGYAQAAIIFPLVVAAPRYFSGAIELGVLMQIRSAFGEVQSSLSWFIGSYGSLTAWKASVDRLLGFHHATELADEAAAVGERNIVRTATTQDASQQISGNLSISLPDQRLLKNDFKFLINAEGIKSPHSVIQGASGSGKSTFFRVLAGLWPFAKGTLSVPARSEMMFFPQKPFLPLGTLQTVCAFPSDGKDTVNDQTLLQYFNELHLPLNENDLKTEKDWSKHLSVGEQQRLVLIRAVLKKPRWLFLDEATASLDDASDVVARNFLSRHLPDTNIVEIAHKRVDPNTSKVSESILF